MRRIGIFLLRSVRRGSVPDIRYRSKVICSHWPNDVEELFLRYFSLAVDRILCTQQVKFDGHLEELGATPVWFEQDGGHDWLFWETALRHFLDFCAESEKNKTLVQ